MCYKKCGHKQGMAHRIVEWHNCRSCIKYKETLHKQRYETEDDEGMATMRKKKKEENRVAKKNSFKRCGNRIKPAEIVDEEANCSDLNLQHATTFQGLLNYFSGFSLRI